MGRVYITFIFCLFGLSNLVAQGTMHKQNGHFIAQLDFFGNYPMKSTAGHIKGGSLDYGNGFTNTNQKKYTEKGITVYGLVKSAVLKVDWWALFGEPTEQYQFEWISSGYYDISFTDSKGKVITTKINKNDLTKYPDLLKRFNYLAPTEMAFEIKWKMGKPNEADIKKIEDKYTLDANFYSGLGLNYLNANRLYRTDVKNSSLLFEPSGTPPFATPSIRSREEFLGISQEDHIDTDIKRILSWWQFCQTHTIDGFKVVKQNWPIEEMKAIAEKYLAYENGEEEPTPKEQIAQVAEKNKNMPAYDKDDFWGDAVEETFTETELITSNDYRTQTIKEVKSGKTTFIFNPKEEHGAIGKIGKYFYTMEIDPNPSERYKRYDKYYYIIDHKGKKKKILGYEKIIKIETYANSTSDLYILESEKFLRTIKLNINWNQSASHEFTTDCNAAESQILKYENPPKGANANAYYRNLIKIRIDNNTLRVIKMEKGCDAANWFSFSK